MITKFDVVARVIGSAFLLAASAYSHTVWPAVTAALFAFNAGMCFGHLRTRSKR